MKTEEQILENDDYRKSIETLKSLLNKDIKGEYLLGWSRAESEEIKRKILVLTVKIKM